MNGLFFKLSQVVDEESFISFVELLGTDFSENHNEWQNQYINDYFSCASDWARVSIDGLKNYERTDNPWRRAADILYMGKIYE